MSIKRSFNGATIRKPGSYSKFQVDNSAGSALGAADVIMLVGESSKGAPGSVSGIQSFPIERLDTLIQTYGAGPIVDCAVAAGRPSRTPGIGGPSQILVWKTNASTQASAMLKKSTSNIFQVLDSGFGSAGNQYSVIIATGDTASQKTISVAQIGGTTEALGENPAQNVLSIRYIGNATTATVAIAGGSQNGKTLTTVLANDQTDGSLALSIPLKNYTMSALAAYINAQPGYSASLLTTSLSQTIGTNLDSIAAVSIEGATVNLLQLQQEILAVLNSSARISAVLQDTPVIGLPDNSSGIFLVGGAQGASANSDFSTGMANSLAENYNVLLTCVSRDASVDIADAVQGFTDPASSYTIASILAAQDSHLRLRASTAVGKEAAGFGGYRSASKATAFAAIANVGSEYMQICMQDVLMIDALSNSTYKHPHVTAAFAAGMRAGQEVGEPLTHKFPAVLDVGHFINPVTGLSGGDFNPNLDASTAIDAGVLYMEKAQGGFWWVVDNTTYGVDDSFVFNRGSVMYASFFVFKTLRDLANQVFVGHKVSNGAALSAKNIIRNKLRELNQPDVNIITSSSDAPEGFIEATFVVTIVGNTMTVQVEFKPVQGLDFVFYSFTLGDITQSA